MSGKRALVGPVAAATPSRSEGPKLVRMGLGRGERLRMML